MNWDSWSFCEWDFSSHSQKQTAVNTKVPLGKAFHFCGRRGVCLCGECEFTVFFPLENIQKPLTLSKSKTQQQNRRNT